MHSIEAAYCDRCAT